MATEMAFYLDNNMFRGRSQMFIWSSVQELWHLGKYHLHANQKWYFFLIYLYVYLSQMARTLNLHSASHTQFKRHCYTNNNK